MWAVDTQCARFLFSPPRSDGRVNGVEGAEKGCRIHPMFGLRDSQTLDREQPKDLGALGCETANTGNTFFPLGKGFRPPWRRSHHCQTPDTLSASATKPVSPVPFQLWGSVSQSIPGLKYGNEKGGPICDYPFSSPIPCVQFSNTMSAPTVL